jgi:5-methylcytosine-specific restriction enzyme subunit McrC
MLHGLCYFLLNNKLLTTDDGKTKMAQFSDEHMNLLFQRFILEYYKYHHSDYKAYSKQINWDLESFDSSSANMLPIMQTDTTLTLGDRTLIIDAKYYGKTLQENFGKLSIHSSNMYQIHAYVTNEDISHKGNVDGLLLYAATSDEWQPNYIGKNHYGNVFMAKSINLNKDFNDIKQQLEDLTKYKTE